MSDSRKPIEVGYWAIRGLAAPLRMMCHYAQVEFTNAAYEVHAQDCGGWDLSSWFAVKSQLIKLNPLLNLPYIRDFDADIVVTQSNACMLYLGRKCNLNGANDLEQIKNEQCLCQVMDLRDPWVNLCYSSKQQYDTDLARYLSGTLVMQLNKFEAWLKHYGTQYLGTSIEWLRECGRASERARESFSV
jgi:hypothetical protein